MRLAAAIICLLFAMLASSVASNSAVHHGFIADQSLALDSFY